MKRIMIADNDLIVQEKLANLLQGNRYDVSYIDDYSYMLDDIKMSNPQLIILDINLQNRNDFSICRKVRAYTDVPIIFVANQNTDIDELISIMRSGDAYMMKPYSTIVLLTHINAILKNSNTTQYILQ
ncbi:MAG TPA: response regulator [Lachnospiraceae bacterium]|nr:response regulator [Lachnospiraceae bacterium]